MNKYATLHDTVTRDIKHLAALKKLYKKKYKNRGDPVLLRALRRREIELTCIAKEIGEFVMVD
jgi:hypothetical protein